MMCIAYSSTVFDKNWVFAEENGVFAEKNLQE